MIHHDLAGYNDDGNEDGNDHDDDNDDDDEEDTSHCITWRASRERHVDIATALY